MGMADLKDDAPKADNGMNGNSGQQNAQPGAESAATGAAGVPTMKSMSFGTAIAICLRKYASFGGRASRAEFWWFFLFSCLLSWVASAADAAIFGAPYGQKMLISCAVSVLLLLPSLGVTARRLHDTGRTGWWMLIGLTIIGIPLILIFCALATKPETNKYGPQPGING